jgi:hypothetical protein
MFSEATYMFDGNFSSFCGNAAGIFELPGRASVTRAPWEVLKVEPHPHISRVGVSAGAG